MARSLDGRDSYLGLVGGVVLQAERSSTLNDPPHMAVMSTRLSPCTQVQCTYAKVLLASLLLGVSECKRGPQRALM